MSLRFFVFGSRTVLPDGHHSGIMAVSMCRSLNPFFNAFCAFSNFFQQKFWMPSIPGAVQFYRLAISFFIFSSVMANSLTRFALSPSSAFTSFIHDGKFTHKICSLCQFSFHLFHPQQILHWLDLFPDASPNLNKSLHLRHVTFALFHCFQSRKRIFGLART